jgi:hypothetical protein
MVEFDLFDGGSVMRVLNMAKFIIKKIDCQSSKVSNGLKLI